VWDEQAEFDTQSAWIEESDVILDAILGTGLNSEVTGLYRTIIEAVNALSIPILAIDIPSVWTQPLEKFWGPRFRRWPPLPLACRKSANLSLRGRLCRRLRVVDIGIPPELWKPARSSAGGWMKSWRRAGFYPRDPSRIRDTQGTSRFWRVLREKQEQQTLVCQGAGRVGAGLRHTACPKQSQSILEVKLTEAMTLPIAETSEQSIGRAALPR